MNENIKKIYTNIADEYKKDRSVLGVALFGSVARGLNDECSDIDIYVVMKNKSDISRKSFVASGVRVEILIDSFFDIMQYLETEQFSLHRNVSQMFAFANVIYDEGNMLSEIIEFAKKNIKQRTKYTKTEILMNKYSIDDFYSDMGRSYRYNDVISFELNSGLILKNLIELFLKVGGGYLKQPNEMSDYIYSLDSKFGDMLNRYYLLIDLNDRYEFMAEIIAYIYKHSHGPLPEKWEV
ncbi:MAG: nucleotidyltransferase domain-containing protein [Ignavibacteria bacterium]|nr:nucleotidyltransferase domain-containing protein [Ignavibacteria bacterium]